MSMSVLRSVPERLVGASPWQALAREGTAVDVLLQSDGTNGLIIGGVGFLAGLALLITGIQRYRQNRLVADTATEKARSVAVGRTELEGVARPLEESVRQPFHDGDCLYAEWRIEEYRRHDDELGGGPAGDSPLNDNPLDDSPVGGSGSHWETVASGSHEEPFLVADETGAVAVEPDSGVDWRLTDDCQSQWTLDGDDDPEAAAEFDPRSEFSTDIDARRRYTQTVLPPEMDVYVYGQAVPTDPGELSGQDLKIERDTATDRFVVSNRDEESLRSFYGYRAPLYAVLGLVVSAVSLYVGLFIA
jgi:hypothetical protein